MHVIVIGVESDNRNFNQLLNINYESEILSVLHLFWSVKMECMGFLVGVFIDARGITCVWSMFSTTLLRRRFVYGGLCGSHGR